MHVKTPITWAPKPLPVADDRQNSIFRVEMPLLLAAVELPEQLESFAEEL